MTIEIVDCPSYVSLPEGNSMIYSRVNFHRCGHECRLLLRGGNHRFSTSRLVYPSVFCVRMMNFDSCYFDVNSER